MNWKQPMILELTNVKGNNIVKKYYQEVYKAKTSSKQILTKKKSQKSIWKNYRKQMQKK